MADLVRYTHWRRRLPIRDDDHNQPDPSLNVAAFPPAVAEQMFEKVLQWMAESGRTKPRKKRRSPTVPQDRPLTLIETTTLQEVASHGGNIAAAAAKMGKNPKTVKENYDRAHAKMNRISGHKSRSVNAGKLPEDRRGQANVPGKVE